MKTASQTIAANPDRPTWEPALEALAQTLVREQLPTGSTMNVVLSNHFVRYGLVPWNDVLVGEQERLSYAKQDFHSVYGDAASGWDVRLSHDRFGAPAIASAVDTALLDALTLAAASHSLRLGSVQPYFMSAFNRFRHQIGRNGAFVVVEPGKLVIGTFENECWRWIGGARLAPGQDLAGRVQQVLYQAQQWDVRSVTVHAGAPTSDYWSANSALHACHLLRSDSIPAVAESALALTGGV